MVCHQPVTVMIPLGGIGSRFQKEGFAAPKPFIKILGKEMILWILDSLNLQDSDQLVIVFNPAFLHLDDLMRAVVLRKYPRATLVHLDAPTRGAAETVLRGLEKVSDSVRGQPVMLMDGDTFYAEGTDVISLYREICSTHGASFVFHDAQPEPLYSYCRLADDSSPTTPSDISEIREKVKISDWANSGCYCFRSGNELAHHCKYYTSGVIARMLKDGHPFKAIPIPRESIEVVGVPAQVEKFCCKQPVKPQRFVFQVEETLLAEGLDAPPNARVLQFVTGLAAAGHCVVMRSHAQSALFARAIEEWLVSHKVPYASFEFGQPPGEVYVDSRVLFTDLAKETGFYV